MKILYNDEVIGDHRLDLLINGQIIIELKAVKSLDSIHQAQLFHYLKASGKPVGLLLNF